MSENNLKIMKKTPTCLMSVFWGQEYWQHLGLAGSDLGSLRGGSQVTGWVWGPQKACQGERVQGNGDVGRQPVCIRVKWLSVLVAGR